MIDELSKYNVSFQSGFEYNSSRHVWHLFPIKIEAGSSQNRNKIMNKLFENYGIKCALQFYPLYKYDLFKKMATAMQIAPISRIISQKYFQFLFMFG